MESRYRALLDEIAHEIPGFRVVKKIDSRFQRAIHGALIVVTFGAQRRYLTDYQTTIGRTVYVTSDWDDYSAEERYITMRHEREHLRQFQRYTLPLMAVLYLLVPFPLGLAWFRAKFEMEGYAETIRATAEVYGKERVVEGWFKESIIEQFTSGSYGWMWPFREQVGRWYDSVVAELEARA